MSFLAIEPLLIARLEAALPGVRIMTAESLEELEGRELPPESVNVIYGGVRPLKQGPGNRIAVVQQHWLAVPTIKHAAQGAGAELKRKSRMAPLVDGVLAALMGWQPGGPQPGGRAMALAPGPGARFRTPYYYFPLAFTVETTVGGANP